MSSENEKKGEDGEIQVGLALCKLDRAVYHDLHNVTLEAPDGTTQVDHVVVSRYGIFVVETKNYQGWIFGGEWRRKWTQSLPGGAKFQFQNPLHQNHRHIKVLAGLLGLRVATFHSVVAFCGESKFKTEMPEHVLSSGYDLYIRSKTDVLLAEGEVLRIVEQIKTTMLPRGEATHKKHLESLNARHGTKGGATAEAVRDPVIVNSANMDKPDRAEAEGNQRDQPDAGATRRIKTDTEDFWKVRIPRSGSGGSPKSDEHPFQTKGAWKIPPATPCSHETEPVGPRRGRKAASLASVFLSLVLVLVLILVNQLMSGIVVAKVQKLPTQSVSRQPDIPSRVPEVPRTTVHVPEEGTSEVALQAEKELRIRKEAELARIDQWEESAAKQAAWQRWYKRPQGCDAVNADIVECANQYIVAKREFERAYAAGRLR